MIEIPTPELQAGTEALRHREKMEKRKAAQDAEVAAKTIEKGLLIVNTGPGKGKSTAAFGLSARARPWLALAASCNSSRAHGRRASATCSTLLGDLVSGTRWARLYLGDAGSRPRRRRRRGRLGKGRRADGRSGIRLVVLDELNIALRYDYLPIDDVVAALMQRAAPDLHVVVTGRNANRSLDRSGRSRHRDDSGEAPFRGWREGAGRHRI